ncbi:MAG: DUF87 domain-containing protein [Spirochaetes bacterium]|nr:DUF87 domain-containing protein [Spirochaetota bacterium]
MTKVQKKQIIGTILFILATIQIINFARLRVTVFPVFYLDFSNRSLLNLIIADLNWPFKFFNYLVYYLLGWAGLLTPFFFYLLGYTFFSKKETQRIKRKRVVLIWGLGELALLIYVVNYVSFIILPNSIQPGVVAHIFANYLKKIGGFAFISLFFIWSGITYYLFLNKSNWKILLKRFGKNFKRFFFMLTQIFSKLMQPNRRRRNSRQQQQLQKLKEEKRQLAYEKKQLKKENDQIKKNEEEKNGFQKAEVDLVDQSTVAEVSTEPDEDPHLKQAYIDVDFNTINIKEFDSRKLAFDFNFEALASTVKNEVNSEEFESLSKKIENTFSSQGIILNQSGMTIGPRLFRFEYDFPENIQLKEIEKFENELSYRLGGMKVNFEIPIAGTSKFGIYIGRDNPDTLGLKTYFNEIQNRQEKVPMLMGIAPDGQGYWCDATAFPHLLVGGTTGSGKSVFLNSIIINLIAVSSKIPVNILLIDPKHVEFTPYKKLSQLAHPIITESEDARKILIEAEQLMDTRYQRITQAGVRNIFEYNEQTEQEELTDIDIMPFLFIIIDEFADLVMQDKSGQIKKSIIRIAQKSRAVGIHVVIATQRPSADIIDGLIKANFPSRVAFKTSSKVDSRIVLDENGSESLLGKGDMIVKIPVDDKKRLQGIFVSIKEIKNVVHSKSIE